MEENNEDRRLSNAGRRSYKEEMSKAAESAEQQKAIEKRFQMQTKNVSDESKDPS
jgi:hypothetical protein